MGLSAEQAVSRLSHSDDVVCVSHVPVRFIKFACF